MKTKNLFRAFTMIAAVGLMSVALNAQSSTASRYDSQVQTAVAQKLAAKSQFRDVKSSVEDGIVTLTGTVDVYQRKLDAAHTAKKVANVSGVRNLVTVAGPTVSDTQLEAKLAKKLTYVRAGLDNTFDYFALGVKDGVATVTGETLTPTGRDEALAEVYNLPGVKDVVANISVAPVSFFDDGLRLRAARAIYRDSALSRYALDPAKPIRIIVDNGHVTLYGAVASTIDKQIAGIRAGQLFGAFSVDNKLEVEGKS